MSASPDGLERQFVAGLLASEATPLARRTARLLIERSPDAALRSPLAPGVRWEDGLRMRLLELSTAVGTGEPRLFADQIAWTKSAGVPRGAAVEDLRAALSAIEDAVTGLVPPDDLGLVRECVDAGRRMLDGDGVPSEGLEADTKFGEIAARYLLALLEGDRGGACRLLIEAAQGGTWIADLYQHVITPAMRETGRLWELGDLNVAEEHLISATTLSAMAQLMPRAQRQKPSGRTIVAACVHGNTHEIGIRMVADLFELAGWRSIYLGQDVPAEDLASVAAAFSADVVALSAMLPPHLDAVTEAIGHLRSVAAATKVLIGGRVLGPLPELWPLLGADGFASTPIEAIAMAEGWFAPPGDLPPVV